MTSGSSSWKPESRLLDSAVRDAVGHVGVSSSGGNPSRRTESGVKRMRSVVVGSTGNPDLPSDDNGQHHHQKPRLDMGLQGTKIPPGVAVAMKAAAAAAEDVNNNSKGRMRSFGSVWDRLGNKSSERLGLKQDGAQEATRLNAGTGEEEDTLDDIDNGGGDIAKAPSWRTMSERLGPREEEDVVMAHPGRFGYGLEKRAVESQWYDRGMKLPAKELSDVDDRFGESADYTNGGFLRYGSMNEPYENVSRNLHGSSGSLFYRHGEGPAQGLPQGLMSGLPNRVPNIHINSNARYLLSNDADIAMDGSHNFYSQLSSHGAALGNPSGPSLAVVDANDVWEMKKRMRQVQLEMTKLRAKQAEVSKEAKNASSAPASVGMKPRSQEEIDQHSVCVINTHFAATKEVIAAHFSNCGDIMRVTVLMDTATGKPRGSAYVEFTSKDGVEKALKMNDSSLLSRTLKVVRKNAATESVVPQSLSRPNHGPYLSSMRLPAKFIRHPGTRRPVSMPRSLGRAANLQWKRETSSPATKTITPNFGHTNGTSVPSAGRIAALRSPSSMMGDRYGLGPIRMTRSLSYVRPAPYPTKEKAAEKT